MNPSRRILLVDDDHTVLLNLAAYLEDEGYSVVAAAGGEQALQALSADRSPEVAIVDLRLAGMNGEELVLQLHRALPRLRFLIHTGSSRYTPSPGLRAIGVREQDVLFKPLADMGVVCQAIRRLAERETEEDRA